MKSLPLLLVVLLALTFPAGAADEHATAPQRLEGHWYGPDRFTRSHSQEFELKAINVKAMTAMAKYSSNQWRCMKDNIPLRITSWDGTTLRWTLMSVKDVPPCLTTLDGEVTIGKGESI